MSINDHKSQLEVYNTRRRTPVRDMPRPELCVDANERQQHLEDWLHWVLAARAWKLIPAARFIRSLDA